MTGEPNDFEHHCDRWYCSHRELSPVPPTTRYQGLVHRIVNVGHDNLVLACGETIQSHFVTTRHGHFVDGGSITCLRCIAAGDFVEEYMKDLRKFYGTLI